MTKLKEIGWAGHLPQMICMRNTYKIPVKKLDWKLLEDLDSDVTVTLREKLLLKKNSVRGYGLD